MTRKRGSVRRLPAAGFAMLAAALARVARRVSRRSPTPAYGLAGDYASWEDARAASTGYDAESVLEVTRVALLAVKNGDAVHERDSVLFAEIEYAWPVLAGLMWVAARRGGALNVLDFGGSLGTSYFQNRVFLSLLPDVRWNIVEQPRHVEIGRMSFQDDRLRFYPSVAACLAETLPNAVLFSGVLQYLEHPYAAIDELLPLPGLHVIFDRTPFWSGRRDRLCVQTVPPSIYTASYPSWVFSRSAFRERSLRDWEWIVSFASLDRLGGPIDTVYEGALMVRRMM